MQDATSYEVSNASTNTRLMLEVEVELKEAEHLLAQYKNNPDARSKHIAETERKVAKLREKYGMFERLKQ